MAYDHSDLPAPDREALEDFMNVVIQAAQTQLKSHGLSRTRLQWEHPHHRYVWYGPMVVVIVGDPASGDTASLRYKDARNQSDVDPQIVMREVQREFGFQNPFLIAFPRTAVNATGKIRRDAVEAVAQRLTRDIIMLHELSSKLGITEAVTYLTNARRRFEEGTAEAMGDVKTNCRNAIESLIRTITGTTNFAKGKQALVKQGIFNQHEAAFVDALASLLEAFFNVTSRPGSHPPLPSREDASFVLQVTEATVQYVAQRALAAKR
ncbi:MAG TPA: hypothetical protein VKV57_06730 [bacterium]|nr:hypothetical protein [bacterium]